MAARFLSHVGQQRFFVLGHVGDRNESQRQQSHGRIEEGHGQPHVAECFGEHSLGLFFDKVGRAFEPGNAQQRRRKSEKYRQREPAFGRSMKIGRRASRCHSHATKPMPTTNRTLSATRCVTKIAIATRDDSEMPMIVKHMKMANKPIVAAITGSAGHKSMSVMHRLAGGDYGRGHV